MKDLETIKLADILPDSIGKDATVAAAGEAIDPQLKAVSKAVNYPLIYARIDSLTSEQLEHLAVQYDLSSWRSDWPLNTKRQVLKTAIADKRKKGTRGAVQRAIEAIAPITTITEWWQTSPHGTPHTFRIDTLQDGEAIDAQTQADVIAQVNDAKPLRSHFDFTIAQLGGANLNFCGFVRGIGYNRIRSTGMVSEQASIQAGVMAMARPVVSRWLIEKGHMGDMPEPVIDLRRVVGAVDGNEIKAFIYQTSSKNVINLATPKGGLFEPMPV